MLTVVLTMISLPMLGLTYASYRLDLNALNALLNTAPVLAHLSLPIIVAFSVNVLKAGLAICLGYLPMHKAPAGNAMKLMVVIFSIFAGLMVISNMLASPNIDAAIAKEKQALRLSALDQTSKVKAWANEQTDAMKARIAFEQDMATKSIRETIETYEHDLKEEMKITDKDGNFIGKRYRELRAKLESAKQDLAAITATFTEKLAKEHAALSEQADAKIEKINSELEEALKLVTADSVSNSREAQNQAMQGIYAVIDRWQPESWDIQPVDVSIALSLLITLIIEFGPIAGFYVFFAMSRQMTVENAKK